MNDKPDLLEVRGLKTYFRTEHGVVPSVDGVSFALKRGEVVGIVGESGSGKSVTAYSIAGLIDSSGRIEAGEIVYNGQDLTRLTKKELRKLQGSEISMVFQEPYTSLNPLLTSGYQIAESIREHQRVGKKEARRRSVTMLKKVGIPHPETVYDAYPHELSGGMRQRVMIALALACGPKLLIADEPTTALDVTIQAQILRLMRDLQDELSTAIILITHDVGVVAEMADKVIVMYAGQVVEEGDVFELFRSPKHPYTKGLLHSTPKIHSDKEQLEPIPGTVPSPSHMPSGCRFHPRCPYATYKCTTRSPELQEVKSAYGVRCWLHENGEVSLDDPLVKRTAVVGG